MTVGDLLRAKAPAPPMVSVWVDGKLLAGKETETFLLPDGANVRFFPVVGGG
ncbi:MoaD/ThiS family protein [Aminiphilus circumscriptus]|uniref:MoaD/ThiS family protein n=1 Tax=Aminiphilus circumscriptus TaxID=290732 RepID=UPI003B8482C2